MMGQYSPALASSLNALVAGTNVQNSLNAIPAVGGDPLASSLTAQGAGTNVQNSPKAIPAVDSVPLRIDPGGVKQQLEALLRP